MDEIWTTGNILGLIMDIQRIEKTAAKLDRLPFPRPPVDDSLADWIMDLLDADGYYAGLAQSALYGGRVRRPPDGGLSDLRERLSHLVAHTSEDEKILDDCRIYFSALEDLEQALRS
ncbi:hypothetical protein GCM10027418_30840 [Mariniluteicoccus endophyticus]